MTLKDWRKGVDDEESVRFYKDMSKGYKWITIYWDEIPEGKKSIRNQGFKHLMYIEGSSIEEQRHAFKTKSQAIAFARRYMRSH
ncbi:MAG: hypothetical protein KKF56_05045 [Nanoarchaeota archaeon]|nr:hypothetical protein [Nanoarchaeota archaeon]